MHLRVVRRSAYAPGPGPTVDMDVAYAHVYQEVLEFRKVDDPVWRRRSWPIWTCWDIVIDNPPAPDAGEAA